MSSAASPSQRAEHLRVWAEAVLDCEKPDVDRGHDGRANIRQRVAVEAAEDVLALVEAHKKMVPIIAALAIYGEQASLPQDRPTREEALRVADDLLRRLAEWDMLGDAPDGLPITADGPYWHGEIARTRAYIAEARP